MTSDEREKLQNLMRQAVWQALQEKKVLVADVERVTVFVDDSLEDDKNLRVSVRILRFDKRGAGFARDLPMVEITPETNDRFAAEIVDQLREKLRMAR